MFIIGAAFYSIDYISFFLCIIGLALVIVDVISYFYFT